MKKTFKLILFALISVSLFSCGDDETDDSKKGDQQKETNDVTYKQPEVTYWKMDTQREIPTLIVKFNNPNDEPVDIRYNFKFKTGDKTIEENIDGGYYRINCIPAGETAIHLATPNIDLNDMKKVDGIEVINMSVLKSCYTPVKATTIKDVFNQNNDHKISFDTDGDFSVCGITVLYYNGDELSDYQFETNVDSDKTPFVFEGIGSNTKYEIFYNAYK